MDEGSTVVIINDFFTTPTSRPPSLDHPHHGILGSSSGGSVAKPPRTRRRASGSTCTSSRHGPPLCVRGGEGHIQSSSFGAAHAASSPADAGLNTAQAGTSIGLGQDVYHHTQSGRANDLTRSGSSSSSSSSSGGSSSSGSSSEGNIHARAETSMGGGGGGGGGGTHRDGSHRGTAGRHGAVPQWATTNDSDGWEVCVCAGVSPGWYILPVSYHGSVLVEAWVCSSRSVGLF